MDHYVLAHGEPQPRRRPAPWAGPRFVRYPIVFNAWLAQRQGNFTGQYLFVPHYQIAHPIMTTTCSVQLGPHLFGAVAWGGFNIPKQFQLRPENAMPFGLLKDLAKCQLAPLVAEISIDKIQGELVEALLHSNCAPLVQPDYFLAPISYGTNLGIFRVPPDVNAATVMCSFSRRTPSP